MFASVLMSLGNSINTEHVQLKLITKTSLFKYTENSRQGGSNEYPQSMFLSRNKKNNVHPFKPQFYYIKVGFKGVNIIKACFHDVCIWKNGDI